MNRVFAGVLLLGVQFWTGIASAAPAADQVLPATTKGFVSFPNVAEFRERWQSTQLGQLAADPVMKPFAEDLQRQLRERFVESNFNVSLTWEDLSRVCGGELCIATVQPEDDEKLHASLLIADVTGHHAETEEVLKKAAEDLKTRGATRTLKKIGDIELILHELPRQRGETHVDRFLRAIVGDTLVLGNDEGTTIGVIERLKSGVQATGFAELPAYQHVMQRVQREVPGEVPQVRWWIDPVGYAEVVRAARVGPKKRGKDMLAIFKSQGFEAVESAGGFVQLATGQQEVLHRTFVYAPGDPNGAHRFALAARMLDFPNLENWEWPSWVPAELASATSFAWNVRDAFEHSSTLVDAIAGDEGFFEDLLTSIRVDEAGPQIDIRKDFVAHLSNRLTVISDYVFPITPQSERLLVAVAVDNEDAVRKTVKKALSTDPDVTPMEVEGYTVWQIINEESEPSADLDSLTIQGIDDPLSEPPVTDDDSEEPRLPNSAITVAHGHFFVATHVDLLRRVLVNREAEDHLSFGSDTKQIDAQLKAIGAGDDSLRSFGRTDESYRPNYELIRQNKMPESESLLGRVLNR
ncbi:MAG: hypothetical protein KDB23_21425, partial [Planctomycetales bacterium]|nr:hypothetical protein [Planctomycetales bacterium]